AYMKATATDDEIRRFKLRRDDVLITKDSETANDIAIPAYVPHSLENVLCGYHLAIVRPSRMTEGRFIFYCFHAQHIRSYFEVSAKGLTRVGLSRNALGRAKIATPPLPEQRTIADFLDHETAKIDGLIAEQRRLIELLQEKRQAVISHAVTKGLDPNAPMKDSDVEWLGEVPEHWEVRRIESMYSASSRPGRADLPVLSVSIHTGITDKELKEGETDKKISRIADREKYIHVKPGDLVYNMMRAWQGAFGAVQVDGLVSPAYVVLVPKIAELTDFMELVLRTPNATEELERRSYGITSFRLRLYWDNLKTMYVPLPPNDEMKRIIKFAHATNWRTEALINSGQFLISLLQERRCALISAAVTGKIDVRNWQADASGDLADQRKVAETQTSYG
ncbi:MAG: restriction endonuclease subunit S, partial [Opitutales bacterium]